MTSILCVCLGNICRSPSAQAVLQHKATQAGLTLFIDSAGTANYHVGERPDVRAIQAGKDLGYDLSALTARQVCLEDFVKFDLILAMDNHNLADLNTLVSHAKRQYPNSKLAQLRTFDTRPVADPYYGNDSDFKQMFTHLEHVADTLIGTWQKELL